MDLIEYIGKVQNILEEEYNLPPKAASTLIDKFDLHLFPDKVAQMTPDEMADLMIKGLLSYYGQKGFTVEE